MSSTNRNPPEQIAIDCHRDAIRVTNKSFARCISQSVHCRWAITRKERKSTKTMTNTSVFTCKTVRLMQSISRFGIVWATLCSQSALIDRHWCSEISSSISMQWLLLNDSRLSIGRRSIPSTGARSSLFVMYSTRSCVNRERFGNRRSRLCPKSTRTKDVASSNPSGVNENWLFVN